MFIRGEVEFVAQGAPAAKNRFFVPIPGPMDANMPGPEKTSSSSAAVPAAQYEIAGCFRAFLNREFYLFWTVIYITESL